MTLLVTDGLPRGLGYLEVDQRNVDAALPPGVQRYFEADTYTCTHCQVVVVMNPARKRERYKCSGCNHHICDPCAADRYSGKSCRTFTQLVDEALNQSVREPGSGVIQTP